MPDLKLLTNDSLELPPGEIFEAFINEDATELGQLVTCTIPSADPNAATDPMPWDAHFTPDGFFYPKRGDRAKVSENGDGPGVVLWWQQSADAEPDATF